MPRNDNSRIGRGEHSLPRRNEFIGALNSKQDGGIEFRETAMAGLTLEEHVRREGDDIWIKATPGRLKAFLSLMDGEPLPPQSKGAADKFLTLLRYASGDHSVIKW